jgi:hypothetical protein
LNLFEESGKLFVILFQIFLILCVLFLFSALTRFDYDKKENDEVEVVEETTEEKTYRRAIEQEKMVYKESFERLKVLKPEIEHVRKVFDFYFLYILIFSKLILEYFMIVVGKRKSKFTKSI